MTARQTSPLREAKARCVAKSQLTPSATHGGGAAAGRVLCAAWTRGRLPARRRWQDETGEPRPASSWRAVCAGRPPIISTRSA